MRSANSTHAINHVDKTLNPQNWSDCLRDKIVVGALAGES